jgi:hypothetical protein
MRGRTRQLHEGILNISSWTVCTHLRRIFAILGVSSRAAMVARLAEFGECSRRKQTRETGYFRGGLAPVQQQMNWVRHGDDNVVGGNEQA